MGYISAVFWGCVWLWQERGFSESREAVLPFGVGAVPAEAAGGGAPARAAELPQLQAAPPQAQRTETAPLTCHIQPGRCQSHQPIHLRNVLSLL